MTLEQFKKLPVYQNAVSRGLIDEESDEWIGRQIYGRQIKTGGLKLHRYALKKILKLKEGADRLNKEEIEEKLVGVEQEVEDFLQKKLIPRKLLGEILQDVRNLQQDLQKLDRAEIKARLEELDDKGAEVDDATFFMQFGTGEYLKNLRESAEKEQE